MKRIEPLQMEINIDEIETYPAWSTTALAHVRINNGDKWTDCWLSAIKKNGRVRFTLSHERGYPSQEKGHTTKHILAHWLPVAIPKI